jgi:hypothetical protein
VDVLFPELLAVPDAVALDFYAPDPESTIVVISNRQPGRLEWYFQAPEAPWTVSRLGDSLRVRFDPGNLANTVVSDTLWVIDTLAVNSPLPIPLSAAVMTVSPVVPTLVATPPELYWTVPYRAATSDSVSLHLQAIPEDHLMWGVTDKETWLYISPNRGITPTELVFRAAFDSLAPGTYSDTISILANASNSPLAIPIEMRVVRPSIIAVPPALEWHARAGAATHDSALLSLVAVPEAPLGWLITGKPAWLSMYRAQGFTPSVVVFRAASDGLPVGIYTDTVWVRSEAANSPLAVPVMMTVDVRSNAGSEDAAAGPDSILTVYPNPFNASTLVSWQQPRGEPYTLEIFNLLGRRVARASGSGNGLQGNTFRWHPDGRLASGVYLVRLATPQAVRVHKAAYLR